MAPRWNCDERGEVPQMRGGAVGQGRRWGTWMWAGVGARWGTHVRMGVCAGTRSTDVETPVPMGLAPVQSVRQVQGPSW